MTGNKILIMRSMAIALFATCLGSPDSVSAAPPHGVHAVEDERTGTIEEFDIPRSGDILIVPVNVDGESYSFAVDTGAAVTVLDDSFKSRLKSEGRRLRSKFGSLELYSMPAASLGKTRLPDSIHPACLDLSSFRKASGFDLRGILGMDFLARHALRIDFDRGRLELLDSADEGSGKAFQLSRDDLGRPTLRLELIANRPVPVCIDTGMVSPGFGEIRSSVFETLLEQGRLMPIGAKVRTIQFGGESNTRKGTLDRFRIGPFEHEQLGVREGTLDGIGLGYLSRYVVTFDFPNDVIYLKRGKRYNHSTPQDMSGLVVVRADGETIIEHIFDKSPAAELGLKRSDIIEAVDGKQAIQHTLFQLRHLLATEDRDIQLVIRRGNTKRDYRLRLKDWQKTSIQK